MRRHQGFTIMEVLVVIGIIGMLMGLLLPVLSSVRATGRAATSMSNLRQWGLASTMYAGFNKECLPYEGRKSANEMAINFQLRDWWANVLPTFLEELPYREISEHADTMETDVPLPTESNSIFIDPAAHVPPEAPYRGQGKQFFFCYVPSSQLNNTFEKRMLESGNFSAGETHYRARVRMPMIREADKTVYMLEMRTMDIELRNNDPHYGRALNRHRSDWKRFAARHFNGGHIAFVDGHVEHVLNEVATTNRQGTRNPSEPDGDWNTRKLIWDPLGPATDD